MESLDKLKAAATEEEALAAFKEFVENHNEAQHAIVMSGEENVMWSDSALKALDFRLDLPRAFQLLHRIGGESLLEKAMEMIEGV